MLNKPTRRAHSVNIRGFHHSLLHELQCHILWNNSFPVNFKVVCKNIYLSQSRKSDIISQYWQTITNYIQMCVGVKTEGIFENKLFVFKKSPGSWQPKTCFHGPQWNHYTGSHPYRTTPGHHLRNSGSTAEIEVIYEDIYYFD